MLSLDRQTAKKFYSLIESFDEEENRFRISLQHFGSKWFCEPILVTARNNLEEKIFA